MNELTVGFIGFGLIGGSIARSIRDLYKGSTIIAYNYYKNRRNPNLELALEENTLNHISTQFSDGFNECDIIFLCAPVLENIEYLKQLKGLIKPDCIITDVGSVKGNIHEAVTSLCMESNFIGGHPMAGSEKTGYSNSNLKLLENAYYILTPTKLTSKRMISFMEKLVLDMNAIPVILDCYEHDDIVSAISHLPHIIAAQLVNLVRDFDNSDEKMRSLAAGGFKDITRIASSSPIMWQNICLTNTNSIQKFLKAYINYLSDVSNALHRQDENYLLTMFETAGEYRNSIPNKSVGMITKLYEIYLDIIDEAGAIATIATILASNNISIKNIGIIHNREFEDGVLRIEFYNQDAVDNAVSLLTKYKYSIYER